MTTPMSDSCKESGFIPAMICACPIGYVAAILMDKRQVCVDIYLLAISAILIQTYVDPIKTCHPTLPSCCLSSKFLMTQATGVIASQLAFEAFNKRYILWRFRDEWASGEREVTAFNPSLEEIRVVNREKYEQQFRAFAIRSVLLLTLVAVLYKKDQRGAFA